MLIRELSLILKEVDRSYRYLREIAQGQNLSTTEVNQEDKFTPNWILCKTTREISEKELKEEGLANFDTPADFAHMSALLKKYRYILPSQKALPVFFLAFRNKSQVGAAWAKRLHKIPTPSFYSWDGSSFNYSHSFYENKTIPTGHYFIFAKIQ